MRLLHTSDWHLGRSFHREDLLGAQAAFVDHLVGVVRSERVDAVLISGDLYDRALPPVDAVALCGEALRRLAAERVRVVVIAGNHDSARRLGFGAELIDAAGVHLRMDPARCGEPVLLGDEHGPVAVYGVPYLEPEAVRAVLGPGGQAAVLASAVSRVRADLTQRAAGVRSVLLAHTVVVGGATSDSERDISMGGVSADGVSVGGVSGVPLGLFGGLSYVALGHLHGAQSLSPRVRYSGSPLAYSFSEEHQRKSSWLLDLGPSGEVSAQRIDCPVPRRLARIRGHLEELLADPALTRHEGAWLQVTLTDPVRPRAPMERLRGRFPHTLELAFSPEGGQRDVRPYSQRVAGLGDRDLAARFVADVRSPAAPAELDLLGRALAAERLAEAAR